jgi:hypothetical protein
MTQPSNRRSTERRYPGLYEKLVPVALVVIGLIVAALLVIIFGVALGLFPGA